MDLERLDPLEHPPSGASSPAAAGPRERRDQTWFDIVRKHFFTTDVRAPAWVDDDGSVAAILYRDEVPTITPDEQGMFAPSAPDDVGAEVHLSGEPPTPWDRSTVRVRFQVSQALRGASLATPNPGRPLRPGEVGWVRLAAKRREVPIIPSYSVLDSADGSYVLVASPDGHRVQKRAIEIGRVFGGMTTVVSGLRPRERVVVSGAFFLDAERRLQHAAEIEVPQ
jgi:multidrug efflux pump subunit AcrA (membrane-fusion protein)